MSTATANQGGGAFDRTKVHVTAALVGHVDCGKTTLMGHVLYKRDGLPKRTKERIAEEERLSGLAARFGSWVTRLSVERERGITVDVGQWRISTQRYEWTLLDTPGHRDFIKNTIGGLSRADVGVVVVAAPLGEFEAGMCRNGQTREHILLCFTMGVKQLIVVVNKIDDRTVRWSESRFNEIKDEVSIILSKTGFNAQKIPFIPLSAWQGDNVIERSSRMPWYHGPTFLDTLDVVEPPKRPVEKPLRIPLSDVYFIGGVGTVAVGKVESGILRPSMVITFAPANITTEVKSIEMHHTVLTEAKPGDYVGFNVKNVMVDDLERGFVAGDAKNNPPSPIESFVATIIVLNHPGQIRQGYTPVFDFHTAHVSCCFAEIRSKVDRRTGKEIEANPTSLRTGDAAVVLVVPTKPLCVEVFSEFPQLGRFSVRDIRQTIAVGIVKSKTVGNSVAKWNMIQRKAVEAEQALKRKLAPPKKTPPAAPPKGKNTTKAHPKKGSS